MVPGIFDGFLICYLQVQVHALFLKALALDSDAMVEHDLVFYFCDGRTLNRCGMSNKRVQIELVIVYLLINSKLPISLYELL